MSGSMNKVLLIGNLGKDPELKMTPGGQPMARFSVATTESWKDKDGTKQSKTEWHNCVTWGKSAEIAEKFLRKGKQVLIEGRIQYREYQDANGVKKYATDIRVDSFQMLDRREEGDGGGKPAAYGRKTDPFDDETPAPPSAGGGFPSDDDIPF